MTYDFFRGRRLRRTASIRDLFRENTITANDLMMLYFVAENDDPEFKAPIKSMPGQYQLSLNQLEKTVGEAVKNGLKSLMLFGIPAEKDPVGSQAYAKDGIVQQAVKRLKDKWPDLVVTTDVCLCEYTSHGHCGLIKDGFVDNDSTLELLAQTAISHVEAGADMVAPSDMMDGRVQAIRQGLDQNGFINTPIMSYAVKYASAYYGPFRDAAEGAPKFGDRKTYQMDIANSREGLREATADMIEGADILMVKPAGPYLDMVRSLRDSFDLPIAAYQVSGEYSIIKAAGLNGWIDEQAVAMESLIGIKRAGADLIMSYFTEDVLKLLG
ncbi:porphobilinogen synthase [Maridesulfovibrio bastinii]|uniref:porphobilinogen synthase n=1 Tax=Maridesulfovibrio bastinii TaxID=47157 RepID=UPI000418BE5F|nr:porphobilinogen synthase [Maridesulfovibrio bastinii]